MGVYEESGVCGLLVEQKKILWARGNCDEHFAHCYFDILLL